MKRLSSSKKEPRQRNMSELVRCTPPSQRASEEVKPEKRIKAREEKEKKEGKEDKNDVERDDEEKVLSQSLKKRDKNIQENKAMVKDLQC